MNDIVPSRLRELRKSKGLTQDALAKKTGRSGKPKIDKQTISRLERGASKSGRVRKSTLDDLCKALDVDAAVLAGTSPIPGRQSEDCLDLLLGRKSQFNHRITDTSRNALLLVAMRYGIPTTKIYEIAPFLFLWAAEQSLRRREERLADLESRWDEVGSAYGQFPHLNNEATSSATAENIMWQERESIKSRDLFGIKFGDGDYDPAFKEDYDENTENPFTIFLSDLATELGDLAEFDEWSAAGSPDYTVCPGEAAKLVGGDEKTAREILVGNVALHEMPKKLKEKEATEERAEWVRLQAKEKRKRFDDAFPGLSDSINDLIDKPEASS